MIKRMGTSGQKHGSSWDRMRGLLGVGLLLCVATTLLCAQSEKAEKKEKFRETYSASAYARALGPRGVISMTFYVEGFSSDEEIQQLAEALRTKGSDGLLKAIEKLKPKGRLAPVGRTGNDIKVIRSRPTPNGRLITMVTDRVISFLELRASTRSRDYEFGVIQLEVDAEGKGQGVMLAAAKIRFKDDNTIELEHIGIDPVKLMNVRKEK